MIDKNNISNYNELEFLTGISYCGQEYLGIVVNHDNSIITFYDVDAMPTIQVKKEFLELGEVWWWESNRQIPIDVFLHYEMRTFRPYLKTFTYKDVEITKWEWYFGSDATPTEKDTNKSVSIPVKFNNAGEKTITLIITDANGATDTVTKKITIKMLIASITSHHQLMFNKSLV